VDASLDLQSFDWSLPVSQHETDADQCAVVWRSWGGNHNSRIDFTGMNMAGFFREDSSSRVPPHR